VANLTEQQKRTFISEDLYYELRCLLGAATLWKAFKAQSKGFDVVVAMDSVFVHTRCLYKFFTQQQSSHDISIIHQLCLVLGKKPLIAMCYISAKEDLTPLIQTTPRT
jgi:hypothetical protein